MRQPIIVPSVALCLFSALPAAHAAPSWTCEAPGLRTAKYDGGAKAYVHLDGFSRGGNYAVTRKGNVATGVTANGTSFTCRLK
ncbi:hypothetical protein [Ancylobacter sp. G4_0304]|uniref:hypothetical protein n=1 Tax=Ancylobacter sp. G4_0304 TaxID=3114289 RepID=UPI0039C74956